MAAAASLARRLDGQRQGHNWRLPCPLGCGYTLSLCDGEDGTLLAYCFGDCGYHDIISALVGHGLFDNDDGVVLSDVSPSVRPSAADDLARSEAACGIYRRLAPAPGTAAETYLRLRHITVAVPPVLRFGSCPHRCGGTYPAMAAPVVDIDGDQIGIHMTYLRTDGSGKAFGQSDLSRECRGVVRGGTIRLSSHDPERELVLAEGLESTLATMEVLDMPGWSAVSAGGLKTLELPPAVRRICIAADNDTSGAGQNNAVTAARRCESGGSFGAHRHARGRRNRFQRPSDPKARMMGTNSGAGFEEFWDPEDLARRTSQPPPEQEEKARPNGLDRNPWPVLDRCALYGLAGEVVDAITPHSEADPAALLVQLLASFGNAIGRGPYYQVEGDRHATNLYAIIVGDTSKARKGISKGRIEQIMRVADPEWARTRVDSGLSSGEGLIWAVRDPITRWKKEGKGADAVRVEVVVDPGVVDKRFYVIEPEFAGVLAVVKRQGNTLSKTIRNAWDSGDLSTIVKNSAARTTGALISIVGHITADEFRRELDQTSVANGFANRFLITCARRSATLLPFGGALSQETCIELGTKIGAAIEAARGIGALQLSGGAREMWEALYPTLSEGQPGLLGALLARAEAHVMRLAMHYALIDLSAEITAPHLTAATAFWEYAEASARYVFGDMLGDPEVDEILIALRQAGAAGMTRTQIRDLFGRNESGSKIARALSMLERKGRAKKTVGQTGGRPAETWRVV